LGEQGPNLKDLSLSGATSKTRRSTTSSLLAKAKRIADAEKKVSKNGLISSTVTEKKTVKTETEKK